MKKLLFVVIAFSMLYVVFGCGGTSSYPPPKSDYTVKYDVIGESGCRAASLTYENAQGGGEQFDAKLPFSKYYTMEKGSFAYISAQNDNDRGKITCRIYVDGVEWKKSTSSGAYVISTCSGLVGRE